MFNQDIFFFHLRRVGEEQGWYCLWFLGRETEAEDLCIAMEIEEQCQAHSKRTRLPVLGHREVSPGSGGHREGAGLQVGGRGEGRGRQGPDLWVQLEGSLVLPLTNFS